MTNTTTLTITMKLSSWLATLVVVVAGVAYAGDAAPRAAEPKPLDALLSTYEALRADLAVDKLDMIAKHAKALQVSATSAAKTAPSAKPRLEAIVAAAKDLERKPVAKPDEVRASFGELSRAVVALLVADPSLAKGRFVFECPMAQGYKKWVQTSDKLSNPYMGKSMPSCGAASKWEP